MSAGSTTSGPADETTTDIDSATTVSEPEGHTTPDGDTLSTPKEMTVTTEEMETENTTEGSGLERNATGTDDSGNNDLSISITLIACHYFFQIICY